MRSGLGRWGLSSVLEPRTRTQESQTHFRVLTLHESNTSAFKLFLADALDSYRGTDLINFAKRDED